MKGYSVFLIALFSLFEGKEGLNFVKQPSSEIQVVKPGDSLVIDCVGDTEISLCQWRHHKTMIIKAESNNYRRVGDSRTSCSLEIVSVRDEDHGDWYCVPIAEDVSGDLPESNVAKIVVAKKPESFGMVSAERVITTQEDIELELTCMAHSSRPAAKIKWYIGEGSKKPIDSKLVIETITKDNPKNDASTVTVESILKYKFSGPENGKQLRCVAEHVGYQDGREEDNKMLDIEFGPKFTNDNEPAFYFQPETDAEIKVNFTAHPKPFFLEWIIDKLAVKPENNPRSEKYETLTIKDIPHEQDKYQAYLKIKSINEEDVSKSYTLKLHDYQSKFAEYPVKLYLGEKPLQGGRIYVPVSGPGDLSGGAVAGIVIAIIAIVLLLAIIILAKRSRTLCFSVDSKKSPSQSHIDAENPGGSHLDGTVNPAHVTDVKSSRNDLNHEHVNNGKMAESLPGPQEFTHVQESVVPVTRLGTDTPV